MTGIDIDRVRAETPGVAHVLHFNNAGAALMPTPVLDAVRTHLTLEAERGGYEAKAIAAEAVDAVYASCARLINARPAEIALVENATVAWQMAFHAMIADFRPGDKIITVEAEYATNFISYLQAKRARGVETVVAPSGPDGAVDVDALAALIDDRVRLISMTHVPTNGGLINPAEDVGRVARDAGVLYLLDACQSAGQLPLDVARIGCDALSVTGRKYLRGPRGTGFLYMREDLANRLEPPFLDLHAARWTGPDSYEVIPGAKRFENWEFNYAAVLGLGAAVDYALALGMDALHARLAALAETLRAALVEVPGVTVHDLGRDKGGIVTFTKDGVVPDRIKAALAAQSINVSVSDRGSTRLDMERRGLAEVVRASVHYYNDADEVGRFVAAVAGISG